VILAVSDEELKAVRGILTSIVPDAEYLAFGSRLGQCYERYNE
jgi:hypothetical protein